MLRYWPIVIYDGNKLTYHLLEELCKNITERMFDIVGIASFIILCLIKVHGSLARVGVDGVSKCASSMVLLLTHSALSISSHCLCIYNVSQVMYLWANSYYIYLFILSRVIIACYLFIYLLFPTTPDNTRNNINKYVFFSG